MLKQVLLVACTRSERLDTFKLLSSCRLNRLVCSALLKQFLLVSSTRRLDTIQLLSSRCLNLLCFLRLLLKQILLVTGTRSESLNAIQLLPSSRFDLLGFLRLLLKHALLVACPTGQISQLCKAIALFLCQIALVTLRQLLEQPSLLSGFGIHLRHFRLSLLLDSSLFCFSRRPTISTLHSLKLLVVQIAGHNCRALLNRRLSNSAWACKYMDVLRSLLLTLPTLFLPFSFESQVFLAIFFLFRLALQLSSQTLRHQGFLLFSSSFLSFTNASGALGSLVVSCRTFLLLPTARFCQSLNLGSSFSFLSLALQLACMTLRQERLFFPSGSFFCFSNASCALPCFIGFFTLLKSTALSCFFLISASAILLSFLAFGLLFFLTTSTLSTFLLSLLTFGLLFFLTASTFSTLSFLTLSFLFFLTASTLGTLSTLLLPLLALCLLFLLCLSSSALALLSALFSLALFLRFSLLLLSLLFLLSLLLLLHSFPLLLLLLLSLLPLLLSLPLLLLSLVLLLFLLPLLLLLFLPLLLGLSLLRLSSALFARSLFARVRRRHAAPAPSPLFLLLLQLRLFLGNLLLTSLHA